MTSQEDLLGEPWDIAYGRCNGRQQRFRKHWPLVAIDVRTCDHQSAETLKRGGASCHMYVWVGVSSVHEDAS